MISELGESFSYENMHAEWKSVNVAFFDLENVMEKRGCI